MSNYYSIEIIIPKNSSLSPRRIHLCFHLPNTNTFKTAIFTKNCYHGTFLKIQFCTSILTTSQFHSSSILATFMNEIKSIETFPSNTIKFSHNFIKSFLISAYDISISKQVTDNNGHTTSLNVKTGPYLTCSPMLIYC